MPQKLLDAINAYQTLRFKGYFFALTYSKKGKIIYDTSFLIRFEKENYRNALAQSADQIRSLIARLPQETQQ